MQGDLHAHGVYTEPAAPRLEDCPGDWQPPHGVMEQARRGHVLHGHAHPYGRPTGHDRGDDTTADAEDRLWGSLAHSVCYHCTTH